MKHTHLGGGLYVATFDRNYVPSESERYDPRYAMGEWILSVVRPTVVRCGGWESYIVLPQGDKPSEQK